MAPGSDWEGLFALKRLSLRTSRRIFVLAITAVLLVGLTGSASALSVPHPLRKGTGDGKFHVVGTDIIGPNGGKFVPRGVNLGGLEWTPTGFNTAAEFDNLQSWGVN